MQRYSDRPDQAPGRLGWLPSVAIATVCGLCGALFFYRDIILSDFDKVFGDDGDARLAMLLMEHWFRVWSGKAAFLSPIFFYPAEDVIGFTDANFLFGLVYSVGRAFGLTTYGAFQLVVIAWGIIGYGAMFWLLRGVLRLHLLLCLVWSNLFAFSNLNALQVGHMQLLVVATVPLLVGWFLIFERRLRIERRIHLGAGLAIVSLYPLMMFTGFYICWFLALFSLTAAVVVGCWALVARHKPPVADWIATARRDWPKLVLLAVVGCVFSIPFFAAYGPQLIHNPGFTIDPLFLSSFPHLRDLINVGTENWVWGNLITWLIPDVYGRLGAYELLMGVPPGFVVVFAICTPFAALLAIRGEGRLAVIMAVSIWLGLLMIVNVQGHSAWWAVRQLVPGARSLRVVSRYEVLLYAMALMASAVVISRFLDRRLDRLRAGVLAIGCVFLLAEQVQPTFARVSKSADLARLNQVPSPPTSCRLFLLDPSEREIAAAPDPAALVRRQQVDAIYQAMRFDLPTINGLSSLNPTGYWFYDLTSPFYRLQAGMWLARFDLQMGICTLDLAKNTWGTIEPDPTPLTGSINLLDPPSSLRTVGQGLRYGDDGFAGGLPGMWTGKASRWVFPVSQHQTSVTIRFYVVNKAGSDVTILVNGVAARKERLGAGASADITLAIREPIRSIGIETNTFKPSNDGVSNDTRDLGVLVTWLSLGA